MLIHPTRTNLLLLKDRAFSVTNSISILRARRQALMREFLKTSLPFLKSRDDVRKTYDRALIELELSTGQEGEKTIQSLEHALGRNIRIDIIENNLWGLKYKDIAFTESPVRSPEQREYDFHPTTPHLEEGLYHFERIVESMFQIAAYETKLKRLGDAIRGITRQIRVLEERVLPEMKRQIRTIGQYIGEREREAYFRLKKFKKKNA